RTGGAPGARPAAARRASPRRGRAQRPFRRERGGRSTHRCCPPARRRSAAPSTGSVLHPPLAARILAGGAERVRGGLEFAAGLARGVLEGRAVGIGDRRGLRGCRRRRRGGRGIGGGRVGRGRRRVVIGRGRRRIAVAVRI